MNTLTTKATRLTPKQKAAFQRLMQRDGWKNVTPEDAKLLATCKWLTVSQRESLAAKVAA